MFKNLASKIRTHQYKLFTLMLLIYSITILSSFFIGSGYNFSNNGTEYNNLSDDVKFSSDLYDIVEIFKSEEEKDNKDYDLGDLNPFLSNINLQFGLSFYNEDLILPTLFSNLNNPPKYLLYHQLKIYSIS